MSILDDDLFEKCDYQIVKHNLIDQQEEDIPALQQAWFDVFGWYGSGIEPHILIKLLELYKEELGVPYKSQRYSNGPIYMTPHRIDYDVINTWLKDFEKKEYFTKIEDLATFAVGCLNISWKVLSNFELGIYKNNYQIDAPSTSFTPYGQVVEVKSKYDFYRQQIELIIDMIKKGIL